MKKIKKYIPLIITVIVFVIIGIVVFPQIADYKEVLKTINRLSLAEISALFFLTIINLLVYVLPFMAATPGVKYWPAFLIRQTSFLISNGIPGGGTIGVGVQYAMATEYKVPGPIATSGIIVTSIWNMLATMSLPGLAVILLLIAGQYKEQNTFAAILGLIIVFISIAGNILIFKYEKLIINFAKRLESLYKFIKKAFKRMPEIKIVNSLNKFREQTYESIVNHWRSLVITNLIQQFSQFFILYAVIEILQPDTISIFTALAAFAFARIGTFIPLTPGGLGTVDAILVSLLVEGGVSSEVALASTLVWRAATYFPQIIIGCFTFLFWRFKSQKASKYI